MENINSIQPTSRISRLIDLPINKPRLALLVWPLILGLFLALVATFFPNYSSCGFFQIGPCGDLGGFPFPYFSLTEFNLGWTAIGFGINSIFYAIIIFGAMMASYILSYFVKGNKSLVIASLVLLFPTVIAVAIWLISIFVIFPSSWRDIIFILGSFDYIIAEYNGLTQVQYPQVAIETYVLLMAIIISIFGLVGISHLAIRVKNKFIIRKWIIWVMVIVAVIYPMLGYLPKPSLGIYDAPAKETLPFVIKNIIKARNGIRYNLDFTELPEEQQMYGIRVCAGNSIEEITFTAGSPCSLNFPYIRSNGGRIERSIGEYLHDDRFITYSDLSGTITAGVNGNEKKLFVFLEPFTTKAGVSYGTRTYEIVVEDYPLKEDIGIPRLNSVDGWKQYNNDEGYSVLTPKDYVLYSSIDTAGTEPYAMEVYAGSFFVNIAPNVKAANEMETPHVRITVVPASGTPEQVLQDYITQKKFINIDKQIKKIIDKETEIYQVLGDGTIASPRSILAIPQGAKYFIAQQDTNDSVLSKIVESFTLYK